MTLTTQFLTIITMIVGGVYLGAAIQTFRRFEKTWKKSPIFSYMIEISFWLLQTLILFYALYLVNKGELRLYILLALICGFALYKSLLESLYKRLLEQMIRTSVAIYNFMYRLVQAVIIRPIKGLISILIALIIWIWGIILWILILLLKIVYYPLSLIGKVVWRLTPQNVKKFFANLAGIYSKIKNTISKWWKFIRSKRG
ncbi:spore cortex biosynthesis protein YabQ [Aquibacillus koreensis]|uniref:Spore cortex biosynthesis protein YabQ n=1 Tax=Aquibacillus koreensis TaxID=279446 RepID=A0A9X3WLP9_9BACI|nr:spore cortex biosynthesis protein YabQ [Aquibacillus koreensis]MCT2534305.1 spore cortex biosynthesis protein YabQ [Aquibacillus koreensis]MDC3422382.1 spore cortex biosynthesis protein YabQ [Aquibacillus koreensis]